MRLICTDHQERDFISLFELCIVKGFDPALLLKDGGLLSLREPPGLQSRDPVNLALSQIDLDPHLYHFGWMHRKANPVSIHYQKIIEGYSWIALSPAFQWEGQTQILGVKLPLSTLLMRFLLQIWDFLNLKMDRNKLFKSLIRSEKNSEFIWSRGYRISGFPRSGFPISFSSIEVVADPADVETTKFDIDPSVLGFTLRVFLAK